ncbi:TPA: protein rexA [Escherichia coli]|nr:protein rexA [Escherichia coli]HBA8691085.1 protein rexA [Escherichia coli]HBA8984460.1 protein rexA [Escherichia coli]HBA9028688.1 protein rexA [Escherichia coli]HBA9060305.1 protein rexA [Escherichia coli]
MKLNFYAVYIQNTSSLKKQPIDLLSFLTEQVINAKNHAQQIEDYYVFAHHIINDSFILTKTFDSELVKKINRKTLSVDEIRNALSSDESLGFPSFLLIRKNIIGYANTLFGPKTRDLAAYLKGKGAIPDGYSLFIEPLMRDITKDDALSMQFIGRTTVRVENGSKLLSPLLRVLGAQAVDEELLEGLEITVKPKRLRNIKSVAKGIISNVDEQHESIHLKGKEQAADILTEYYLSDKGHIGANIYKSSNEDIASEMSTCYLRMKLIIMESYKRTFGDELPL